MLVMAHWRQILLHVKSMYLQRENFPSLVLVSQYLPLSAVHQRTVIFRSKVGRMFSGSWKHHNSETTFSLVVLKETSYVICNLQNKLATWEVSFRYTGGNFLCPHMEFDKCDSCGAKNPCLGPLRRWQEPLLATLVLSNGTGWPKPAHL